MGGSPLSAREDLQGILRVWRQRRAAVYDSRRRHSSARCPGGGVAALAALQMAKTAGAHGCRRRLSWPWLRLESPASRPIPVPHHQEYLDQLLRALGRRLEFLTPGPVLRNHRRAQAPRLVVL